MTGHPGGATTDPFAVFRPRRGRIVALSCAVVAVLVFGGVALQLPSDGGGTQWHALDRLTVLGIGVAMALLFWRYATIRATPSAEGLVVRNLFITRTLVWGQIVRVEFGDGAPWVSLDLDDTDQLAVMAIQRADGPTARAEASRLVALVQAHQR